MRLARAVASICTKYVLNPMKNSYPQFLTKSQGDKNETGDGKKTMRTWGSCGRQETPPPERGNVKSTDHLTHLDLLDRK